MSKLHLVFGGRVSDPQGLDFVDLNNLDVVGLFPDYKSAEKAWRSAASRWRSMAKSSRVACTRCIYFAMATRSRSCKRWAAAKLVR